MAQLIIQTTTYSLTIIMDSISHCGIELEARSRILPLSKGRDHLATLSYYFVFDHSLMKHPQFLKNQVYREIMFTVQALPWISIPTVSLFLLELRGYSKLYDDIGEFPNGWFQLIVSVLSFLFFTDMLIYWICLLYTSPSPRDS